MQLLSTFDLRSNVLEQKSTDGDSDLLIAVPLRSIKLSKFLWSTQP